MIKSESPALHAETLRRFTRLEPAKWQRMGLSGQEYLGILSTPRWGVGSLTQVKCLRRDHSYLAISVARYFRRLYKPTSQFRFGLEKSGWRVHAPLLSAPSARFKDQEPATSS